VGDIEPDDVATAARPLPADGVVTGTGWQVGDPDWFRLPVLAGGELAVRAEGAVASLELVQGDTVVPLVQDGDGATWRTAEAPPGDVLLTLTALGDYTLRVPLATPSTPTAPVLGVELALPVDTVAPWWSAGQRIEGTATITNQTSVAQTATLDTWTSHHDWSASVDPRTLTLEPGATADVPLVIEVAPDAWAGTSVAIAVRAAPGSGPAASGWVTVTPSVDAALVSPHRAWAVPPTLLGGLDVASLAVGGVSDGVMDPVGEAALHDGVAVGGYGLAIPVTDPVSPTTVDLAGDDPVPVTGIIIDPAAGQGLLSTRPRVVELSLSEDGVTWTPALTSEVSPLGIDQAFALPAPVPARYARLAVISTWTLGLLGSDTGFGEADIAEWKVIAAAGVDPVTEPRDIADPVLGGHIVSSQPQFAELPSVTAGMLDADLTPVMAYPGTGDVGWVVGFLHDRAAQVTRIDWQDPDGSDAAQRVKRVAVAVSTGTPLGPWTELGTWQLKRADDGSVAPFVLDAPTWARFVRFTAPGAKDKDAAWELPGRIAVLERPTDDTYRSILAEWGSSQPVGPYELLSPDDDAPPVDDPDVGEGSAAMALDPDTTVGGQVAIGSDVDEYLVRIPDGQHSIRIGARGEPVVGVAVRLFDPDGVEIPLSLAADAGSQVYQANVTSGLTYRVRVEQPPFSAVQMYDTSLSIADYRGPIVEGLTAFAGDVVSGRDHVMVIPFGKTTEPLLDEWSDDAYQLQAVLEGPIPDGGSEVESSVLNALGRLRARAGARAMLLVTDGSTSSFPDGALMWQGLERQRPLVFTVQIGSAPDDPYSTQLLEDLAASSGGVYTYVRTQDEMDRAFDRMATWLRRPVSYRLSYTTSDETLPAPEPGSLSVVTPPGADGEPEPAPVDAHIAIELVLDTSGSMHEQLGKTTRIAAAKQVLERLVRDDLPTGIPVALRWFTLEKQSCDTELAVPLGPLDPDAMTAVIDGITIPSGVRTPLGAAISEVANDLADVTGPRIVVVVTDGRESCGGDPEAAVKALRAQGFDVTVNVVGIGLDKADQKRIRRLAQLGGGTFQDTQGQGQLQDALRAAVAAPVEVYDSTGTLVAKGTVNGPAIEVPPGTYRVVVRTDPVREMDAVVDGGEEVTVTLTP
jgi:Mg-chelatase subunit ChlD